MVQPNFDENLLFKNTYLYDMYVCEYTYMCEYIFSHTHLTQIYTYVYLWIHLSYVHNKLYVLYVYF